MTLISAMAFDFSKYGTFIILIALLAFLYFFMIRPQKKQEKETQEMRNSLVVGDEITTIGGIIGKITSIKGETVTIETSKDKTKIRFLRSAIRSVDVKAEESNRTTRSTESKKSDKQEKKADNEDINEKEVDNSEIALENDAIEAKDIADDKSAE